MDFRKHWTDAFRYRDRRSGGFVLVAVLWILGALASLAVIYSLYARQTALELLDHQERLQAQALAISGVELAAYRITSYGDFRPSVGQFSFRQGTAVIDVAFSAENGRIDLNFAPKELIAGLFANLGAPLEDAQNFADRVVAWRTPLNPGAADNELPLYQAAGKPYRPRRGPFQHVDELTMVIGMPMYLIERALPFLTIYAGHQFVNVLSAPSQVLAALPGVTPAVLQTLLAQRGGAPRDVLQAQLGSAANYVTMQPSSTDRVDVDVRFSSNRHIRSEAVIFVLDRDVEPYQVLSWRDEELTGDQRSASGL